MSLHMLNVAAGPLAPPEDDEVRPPSPYVRFARFCSRRRGSVSGPTLKRPPLISSAQMEAARRNGPSSTLPRSLVHIAHGWYSTRPLTDWEMAEALMEILPEDAVLAGETAAALYGIDVRPTSRYCTPIRICVARPEGQRAVRRPGVRCRVVRLEPGDVIVINGVRRTSPLRTLIDMAASETIEIATHLIERFLYRGYFSKKQLKKRVRDMRGRRGVRTLRRAIKLADPLSESVFETAVRIRLREAGLPQFRPQIKVRVDGRENPYRIDLGYEAPYLGDHMRLRLAVECDSDEYHPTTGPKARSDEQRRREIRAEGWIVLSIRFHELRGTSFTFEKSVARMLGVGLAPDERIPWRRSRWVMRHNAWTRTDEGPGQ